MKGNITFILVSEFEMLKKLVFHSMKRIEFKPVTDSFLTPSFYLLKGQLSLK